MLYLQLKVILIVASVRFSGSVIMNGIRIFKNHLEHNIEHFSHKSLHKQETFDMARHILPKDTVFYIYPQANPDSIKTYYIEQGEICLLETGERLSQGDIIVCNELDMVIVLHFLTDAILLAQTYDEDPRVSFETRMKKLDELMRKIQDKDDYTREHCNRVLQLAKKMGLSLEYKSNRLNNLNKAARFHDIGKIFINDEILNKKGKLDNDEFSCMKNHVELGKTLILEKFNEEIYHIIEQHHERLDGSGYPNRLKDSEITEEARIIAICDSFDAMTHDRVYKKAIPTKEAFEELLEMSDKQYDKALVRLFIQLFEDKSDN
jgi:HD-GYP domain-containing protein (c-di-GMP phosphodiesterase class II)